MGDPMLEKEFHYYVEHQEELLKKHNGKYVVIKGHELLGSYEKILEAIEETEKTHKLGTFLVQKCTPGSDDYTQTFNSRVSL